MREDKRKRLIVFFLVNLLIVLASNYLILLELLDEWWSAGPYNHGLLGLAIALFLILKNTNNLQPTQHIASLLLLAGSCLLLLIANLASIGQLQLLSLFFVGLSLFISVYGFKIAIKQSLPITMILLTLPIWNLLQIPLRELSTWISFHCVQFLGFEITRQGYMLLTPGGNFLVEEACSGLSFFLASALYAIFVAQINHLSRYATLLFLFLALSIAIIANWIRIITIIIVGSQTQMQHFIVEDHLTFGWLVFAGCFLPLIIIGNRYFTEQKNGKERQTSTPEPQPLHRWHLACATFVILTFTVGSGLLSQRFEPSYKFSHPAMPDYKKLSINSSTSPNWHPIFHGVSSEEFHYFAQDNDLIQVYLANYIKQQQGAELIYIGNHLFDKTRWPNYQYSTIQINAPSLEVANLLILNRNKNSFRIIAYWYYIDGIFISDKKRAKWHEVLAAFKGEPGATLIAIAVDYKKMNEAKALKTANHFVHEFIKNSR